MAGPMVIAMGVGGMAVVAAAMVIGSIVGSACGELAAMRSSRTIEQ